MAALTSAPFVFLFTFSGIFAQSQDTKNITVKPGDDVTLPCQGPLGAAIEALEWTRPDLESRKYVFFFRDGSPVEIYQLERYRSRVEIRDPEMKNGDASVVLRNVTVSDTGTYECLVPESNGGRTRRADGITQCVNLNVTAPVGSRVSPPQPQSTVCAGGTAGLHGRGHGGLVATFIVFAVACCTGLVVW